MNSLYQRTLYCINHLTEHKDIVELDRALLVLEKSGPHMGHMASWGPVAWQGHPHGSQPPVSL